MNGMPGTNGSLGECAYCGQPFLVEILTGGKVATVSIDGISGDLPVHKACLPKLEATVEYTDLPENSPVLKAWKKAVAEFGGAK